MDYDGILADVVQLIDDTGRLVTFEQLDGEPADPGQPWRGPSEVAAAASVQARATFVPATGGDLGLVVVSDEMLQRTEQICLAAPSAVMDIGRATSVIDGGVRWVVEWAQTLRPGDVALLVVLGVRR